MIRKFRIYSKLTNSQRDLFNICLILFIASLINAFNTIPQFFIAMFAGIAILIIVLSRIRKETGGKILSFLAWTFGIIALYVLLNTSVKAVTNPGIVIIGQNFVATEFPDPKTSPFYMKPITAFIYCAMAWFYFTLESSKERFIHMSDEIRKVLVGICLVVTAGAIYELLWNFIAWGALMVQSEMTNVDFLTYFSPLSLQPEETKLIGMNLCFATKMSLLFTFIGAYAAYYFSHIIPSERRKVQL